MEDYEEERMFTCLTEEGNRVDGAIEGTKEQVLSWMQRHVIQNSPKKDENAERV